MNRHIRFLVVAGVAASGSLLTLHAEKTVRVTAPDGEATRMSLTTGTRISFLAAGIDVANEGEETVSIPYSRIESISFDGAGLAVDRIVNADGLRLRRNPVEHLLEVDGYSGHPTRLSVASIGGTLMMSAAEWSGEALDVSSLAPGIYLLTVDNTTIKFIKK